MNTSPTIVSAPSQNVITANASTANCRAACGPSAASMPENCGTNAALNAPSPNRRRNRLGSFSATKNASATGPAPSIAAISMSRAKPSTRLAMVQPPTVRTPRSMGRSSARCRVASFVPPRARQQPRDRVGQCGAAREQVGDGGADRQLDRGGAGNQCGRGGDAFGDGAARGQDIRQFLAAAECQAQAVVAARRAGAGQQQVAEAGQAHDRLHASAERDGEAGQL